MAKLAILAVGAASAIALAVLVGLVSLGDKSPPRAASQDVDGTEQADPVDEPAPSAPAMPEVEPPSAARPAVLAIPGAPAPVRPDAAKPLDETSALEKLRDLAASDPPLSLKLARDALQRFPNSPNAPEFAWNVVKSLFNMERMQEAKDEARVMLWKYPGTHFANDVEHHLLNHPPNPSDLP